MEIQTAKPIHITDWKKDEFQLLYPNRLDGWGICHLDDDKVAMYIPTQVQKLHAVIYVFMHVFLTTIYN